MINRFVSFRSAHWVRGYVLVISSMACSSISAGIIREISWETNENKYKVVVSEKHLKKGIPERTMLFYERSSGKLIKKYSTVGPFVSAETDRNPSDCFITTWSGGSAYHVEIFRSSKEGIDLVYEIGTKQDISLVPKDLCPDVIIPGNQYVYDKDKPDIYVKLSETYKSLPALANGKIEFGILDDLEGEG